MSFSHARLCFLVMLTCFASSYADCILAEAYRNPEIDLLEKRCEREKSSVFSDRQKPSCEKLEKELKNNKRTKSEVSYRWSGNKNQGYCYYNDRDEPISCGHGADN